MTSLTTHQGNLLRHLLNIEAPTAVADIAHELALTPRQVSYNLKPIKQWLAQYDATLKAIPGVGVALICSPAERSNLLNKLETHTNFQLILTAEQRQQLITLCLLDATAPYILSQLQNNIEASRTTILKDLETVAVWLESFKVDVIRRPNYGFWLDGSELSLRQALTALLWGDVPFENPLLTMTHTQRLTFSLPNTPTAPPAVQRVYQLLDTWNTAVALKWVAYAEAKLGGRFTDDAVLHLVLAFAIQSQRVQAKQHLTIATQNLAWLQAESAWAVAESLSRQIVPDTSQDIQLNECAGIAVHLLGSERSDIWPSELASDMQFTKLITTFITEAASAFGVPDIQDDLSLRDGLAAHIIPAYVRHRFGLWSPPPPIERLSGNLAFTLTTTREIVAEVTAQTGISLPESELNNLVLLLRAALIRARPKRQARVFVVCPSGMATAQLLVARLRARFSRLDIVGVLSVRALTADKITSASLIISTIPLDKVALGVQVIQVHPLLLPEDIETITRWLA